MTFAPIPPPPAPPPPPADKRPRRFSRTQRAVMASGLAAGLALGGAGISFAASSGSSTTTTPPTTKAPSGPNAPNAPVKPGHGLHGFGRGMFGFGGLGRVLHGEVTVQTSNGPKTIVIQSGTATVAPTAANGITVKSSDGYTHTYPVTAQTTVNAQVNGINSVKAGDQVQVIANGSNTAVRITDITGLQQSGNHFGFGPGSRPGQPAGGPRTAVAGVF
jgi:hypothetical protein